MRPPGARGGRSARFTKEPVGLLGLTSTTRAGARTTAASSASRSMPSRLADSGYERRVDLQVGQEVEERIGGRGDQHLVAALAEQLEEPAVSFAGAGGEQNALRFHALAAGRVVRGDRLARLEGARGRGFVDQRARSAKARINSGGYSNPARVGLDSVRSICGAPARRRASSASVSRLGRASQWKREENMFASDCNEPAAAALRVRSQRCGEVSASFTFFPTRLTSPLSTPSRNVLFFAK